MQTIELSIVIPLYNEQDSVCLLYDAITQALITISIPYEIIMVDDGSNDDTFSILKSIALKKKELRVIQLNKNFGQTPAMVCGIEHARGNIIVTMDGDLQNDPRDIPKLIDMINRGYDIVVGWRHLRQDKYITRVLPSKIANWIIGKTTGIPIKDNGCSLKAYRAQVIKNVPLYNEMHRFLPAMLSFTGMKMKEIKVRHHARQHGVSKYGLTRIYKVLLDTLTIKTLLSLLRHPLYWFGIISLTIFTLALGFLFISSLSLLFYTGGIKFSILGIGFLLLLLSSYLLFLGILCELIFRTGDEKMTKLSLITADVSHE